MPLPEEIRNLLKRTTFGERTELRDDEHQRIFDEEILPEFTEGRKPQDAPMVVFLAGQPGAGKSGLRDGAQKQMNPRRKLSAEPVNIDPDDLRAFHPAYAFWAGSDDEDTRKKAAENTHKDAMKWVRMLVAECVEMRLNVIWDGTLANSEKELKARFKGFKEGGYAVEVHAIAVPLKQSKLGVTERYERVLAGQQEVADYTLGELRKNVQKARKLDEDDTYKGLTLEEWQDLLRKKEAIPRWVPERIQKNGFDGMQTSITNLGKMTSGGARLVDRCKITNRAGKVLADTNGDKANPKNRWKNLGGVLKRQRVKALTPDQLEARKKSLDTIVGWMTDRAAPREDVERMKKIRNRARSAWAEFIESVDDELGITSSEESFV